MDAVVPDAVVRIQEPTTWVLGGSGLLGEAVVRDHAAARRDVRTSRIPWSDEDAAVRALLDEASLLQTPWRMAWCAGAGVVGTGQDALDAEVRVIERFLSQWTPGPAGVVFVASSAGGVYAGSADPPFTEKTQPVPLAPYGHAKLRIERLFTEHAERHGYGLLIGRLANLYGPGQDVTKAQGLISTLCEAVASHGLTSIFVSLDTLRDYLYVDDAAAMVREGLDAVAAIGGVHTKVLASGRALSISQILGELTRLSRRKPPVLLGGSPSARFQVRDLRLRSRAWPDLDHLVRTPVAVGMADCLAQAAARVRAGSSSRA